MICIYRQKKYGATYCLAGAAPSHCGAWRALKCAVADLLRSVFLRRALRRAAR